MTVADNIKIALPKTDNAKEFMRLVGEHSQAMINLLLGH